MKKLLSLILIFVTVLLLCTGCKPDENKEEPKDKKYDVSMKIVIEGVGEYIFTPDVSEMTVTIPYDGTSRKVYLSGYQYPNHPGKNYRESWLAPRFTGDEAFEVNLNIRTAEGKYMETDTLLDKGSYMFVCEALSIRATRSTGGSFFMNLFLLFL